MSPLYLQGVATQWTAPREPVAITQQFQFRLEKTTIVECPHSDTFRSRRHRKLFLTPAEQAGRPILSVRFPRSSGSGRRVSYDREQHRPLHAVIGARPMNAVTDGATRVVSNPETEGWNRADNFRVARHSGGTVMDVASASRRPPILRDG